MEHLFGTDGIRGPVGQGFFTCHELSRFGTVFAIWARRAFDRPKPQILLVSDTRISCCWIKSCIATGLLTEQVTLHDGGILPTPAALTILRSDPRFDAALVISASHNPYQDNGIKILVPSGKLTPEEEESFTRIWRQMENATPLQVGPESFGTIEWRPEAPDLYIQQLISGYDPHFLRGLTIVLDCANGATYKVAPDAFRRLGACVITLGTSPNGYNINRLCGSLSMQSLQEAVITHKAHIGFAFDGDGDRVLAVTADGQVRDGDDLLAILLDHPLYAETPAVVGTPMTNFGFEEFLGSKGKKLVRAAVGDRFVAQSLQEQGLMLGGEPVGHIILMDGIPSGDGIRVALRIIESIQKNNNWLLESFTKYPQENATLPRWGKIALTEEPCTGIIRHAEEMCAGGRVLVRCSGTEPIIRLMVEARTRAVASQTMAYLISALTTISQKPTEALHTEGHYDFHEHLPLQESI
ncbi:MAG: phosphoglucosamine mutase [Candidatus Dependentiae bacterium]|nr:phosphoglucosamine mutase [Candidatus Dependentiae bacterium]